MEIVADLHLHSKYSRAVSPSMTLPVMATYALQKGINLLTASDWTHPVWFKEIQSQLEEVEEGIYALKQKEEEQEEKSDVKFLLSTEIASIYKQGDKLRRIHNLVFAPNRDVSEKISKALIQKGCNVSADGRPIVGLSARNLLELILSIDASCLLIPCHVWTPHFGVYGSASGFDSLEEAFGEYAKYIYAIETGISSDPGMNWHIKELENRSIVSFSDAHSAPKMGREATVFGLRNKDDCSKKRIYTYEDIARAIKRDLSARMEIAYTIEFFPEEGKYHYSGHRNCKISFSPTDIQQKGTICPVCHRKLTEGVVTRMQQVAGIEDVEKKDGILMKEKVRWFIDSTKQQPPYVKLVPLLEIVAESLHATVHSQKVQIEFAKLCAALGGELEILLRTPLADIKRVGGEQIAEGVQRVRSGSLMIVPGYDGEYGKVTIWEKKGIAKQVRENKSQLRIDF